jgi:hypothetical protein
LVTVPAVRAMPNRPSPWMMDGDGGPCRGKLWRRWDLVAGSDQFCGVHRRAGGARSGERTSGSGDTPPAFDRAAAASEWSSTALQLDQSRCRSVGTRRKLSDTDKRSSFTRAWCFVFGRHSPTLSIRFNVSNWVVFILLEFLNVII